jgi:hypothetical protein
VLALDTGIVRPLNRAAGDCYFAGLYEPTPISGGAAPTPRPGPPATSTPAGTSCARLASAPPVAVSSATPPPAGTPWPLIGAAPTPCPAYTSPAGPLRAWPTVDPANLATLRDFDPCAVRWPKNPNALRPSGGPYISQQEIERRALDGRTASKVRSYLVTQAAATRLMGGDSENPDVYPDREVWLVAIAQEPFQCARPSLRPGVAGWPRRWCFGVYDATTGRSYGGGGNGANQGDWPPFLPSD